MHIKHKNKNTKNVTKCKSKNVDENCKGKTDDKPIWKIIEKKKKNEKETQNFFLKGNTRVSHLVPSKKWKPCYIFKLNSTGQWLNKINHQINLYNRWLTLNQVRFALTEEDFSLQCFDLKWQSFNWICPFFTLFLIYINIFQWNKIFHPAHNKIRTS